jgi:hypothetical protein
MKIQVQYDAPVSAFVDTETGEVERVVVWCEGIEQRDGDCAVVTAEAETPVDDRYRERAQEIVDSVIWPAWDIG